MYLDTDDGAIVWDKMREAYARPTVVSPHLNGDDLGHLDYCTMGQDEVGNIFKKIGRSVSKAGNKISRQLGKIPVVGAGLKGVFDLTTNGPFQLAAGVAKGERLDRVAMQHLQSQVKAAKGVAPYVQTVLSFVPVVGTGINAGLSAGLALASGRPLTSALLEGVRGAIPGGPIATAAFDMGKAAIEGKSLTNIALSALPVGDTEKKAIGMGLNAAARIAKGERVDAALLKQADAAMQLLPVEARTALKTGLAVAQAQNLQKVAIRHVVPGAIGALKTAGAARIKAHPVLLAQGRAIKTPAHRAGFATAVGMLASKPAAPFQVVALRANLPAAERPGFDAAVKAYADAKRSAALKNAPAVPVKGPGLAKPVVFIVSAKGKITRRAS